MARISKEQQTEIKNRIKNVAKIKFDEVGFEKTSTKLIAKEVGIAEGTLFNYFDSKTELFFEVFGDHYKENLAENKDNITLGTNVSEILLNHFQKTVGYMLKIPRGIMGELMIATIRMAKKHPDRFQKLAQYDFDFIDELADYTKRLIDNNILKPVDEKHFAELIFSAIGYELILYIYDTNIKKETFLENVKKKIDILVKGYILGGE